jgi:hypothetical protein
LDRDETPPRAPEPDRRVHQRRAAPALNLHPVPHSHHPPPFRRTATAAARPRPVLRAQPYGMPAHLQPYGPTAWQSNTRTSGGRQRREEDDF